MEYFLHILVCNVEEYDDKITQSKRGETRSPWNSSKPWIICPGEYVRRFCLHAKHVLQSKWHATRHKRCTYNRRITPKRTWRFLNLGRGFVASHGQGRSVAQTPVYSVVKNKRVLWALFLNPGRQAPSNDTPTRNGWYTRSGIKKRQNR